MSRVWWHPRSIGDPAGDRRAVSLQTGCLVLFCVFTMALVRSAGWRTGDLVTPLVAAEVTTATALVLNYFGKRAWAARLAAFGVLFAAAYLETGAHDGFRSIVMLTFPGVLVIGVTLFTGVEYLVLAIATLLTVTALGVAEIYGLLPTVKLARSSTDFFTILFVDLTILTIAIIGGLFARDSRLNLAILRATVDQLARSEAALRDSEERFRTLSDASLEGIMIHDHGVILDANLAFARLFGYDRPDELIGLNGPDLLLTPESRERVRLRMERQETGKIELTGVRRDGASITAESESRPFRHLGRDVRIVTWRDITGRMRAEQDRAKMEAQLNQAHKMESIGRLAGGVAHDFNNLLTVINGYSNLLVNRLGDRERKYAEQIRSAGELAASLTRQLLAFSRNEVARAEPVWLNSIVAESKVMLERLVGEHIEMETSLGAFPDEVQADPAQIHQCLMNLVVNARDAMPAGGRLTVETGNIVVTEGDIPPESAGAPGPYVRLTVRDTGIGMDEDTRQRIFEPFFTTKEKGSGAGLGLSTVYGIVRQWGGFLKCDSEIGKGSQFIICLPLNVTHDKMLHTPGVKPASVPAASETLLVVEDQDIVREFVVESLRMFGYAVLEARNGEEALQLIERNAAGIHLMMTDVMMPGMRGKELAKRAKAVCPAMKVLFMTGYADDAAPGLDSPLATDEVIMKPFAPEALEARVRGLLHTGTVT